jgi:15-cis-phytoene synthase
VTVLTHAWEYPLVSLAHGEAHATPHHHQQEASETDPYLLASAYAYCDQLTAAHSRSFYMASSLLPEDKRRAVRALYAFCRVTDDVVDESEGDPAQELAQWRARAMSPTPPTSDLVALAWADARTRFAIPSRYAEQLINGVGRDMFQSRYLTFDELATYAYGVASTVGLMSMHITGFSGREAIPYAVKLGVALQLTNILRDVAEDWRNGRVYLPQDELRSFGLSESDIEAGIVTDRWREFMRFQIIRNRQLYDEAWPGIGLLNPDGRLAIGAAAGLYRGILRDIERHDYDVFSRRAFVSTGGKLRRLPRIWWDSRRTAPPVDTLSRLFN